MNKSVVGVVIAIIAVVGIGAVAMSSNNGKDSKVASRNDGQSSNMQSMDMSKSDSASQPSSPDMVNIVDFSFKPEKLTIKKGTKITWTNQDSAKHNAYSDNENGPKGKLLAKGESYSFTFATVGSFDVYCEPHPYMKQKIEVTE